MGRVRPYLPTRAHFCFGEAETTGMYSLGMTASDSFADLMGVDLCIEPSKAGARFFGFRLAETYWF